MRPIFFIILLLFCFGTIANAQEIKNDSLATQKALSDSTQKTPEKPVLIKIDSLSPKTKLKRVRFGVLIGPDIVRLDVVKNEANGTKSTEVNSVLGFHFGFATRIYLTKTLYFLPQVSLAFQGTTLDYKDGAINTKLKVAPLTLEIPIHFVLKLFPKYRVMPAFHLGVRYIGDVSERIENPIGIKHGTWNGEVGAGFEFRIWKITLMPQLGVSVGLNNLVVASQQNGVNGFIDTVQRQKFELRFLFF